MLRFISIANKHQFRQVRSIASKTIERPHSHAFYDDKITTVMCLSIFFTIYINIYIFN